LEEFNMADALPPLKQAIDLAIEAILQEAGKSKSGAVRQPEGNRITSEAEPEPPKSS
jgi:hypothetical protein